MTKSELKTGHIVTLRNGEKYMVFRNCAPKNDTIVEINGKLSWLPLEKYKEDLTFNRAITTCDEKTAKGWDIVKVEQCSHPYAFIDKKYGTKETIWSCTEKKKYTYAQLKEILGEEFEIVKE